ncbi:MAG: hypothetical protein NTY41_06955, partial [Proteobacteria bacterium]|nr:hypothetical protein [Pseudomonadota bacterium]
FDEFITIDPMLPALGVQNLRDKPLPYAPKSAFNVAAQYSWLRALERTDVILRVDASHRSRLYFDAFESNYTSDAPLTLWNAHLRFEPSNDKGIYGVIFVKNIGDKHYSTYTQNTSLGSYAWMAQPRTYGIQVGYRY